MPVYDARSQTTCAKLGQSHVQMSLQRNISVRIPHRWYLLYLESKYESCVKQGLWHSHCIENKAIWSGSFGAKQNQGSQQWCERSWSKWRMEKHLSCRNWFKGDKKKILNCYDTLIQDRIQAANKIHKWLKPEIKPPLDLTCNAWIGYVKEEKRCIRMQDNLIFISFLNTKGSHESLRPHQLPWIKVWERWLILPDPEPLRSHTGKSPKYESNKNDAESTQRFSFVCTFLCQNIKHNFFFFFSISFSQHKPTYALPNDGMTHHCFSLHHGNLFWSPQIFFPTKSTPDRQDKKG